MKIVSEDQTTLVAKHQPFYGIIIGLIFVALAVLMWLRPDIFKGQPPL